ncbi:MAG TPA: hypothetical protein PKY35_09655 [Candidatus Hydrogenedentes bacterium]|nr:hypothetical protein [Candidatus Hydrogenedentota bacterium]HOL77283.1 hypothetical protein [Candidatus Hydrogenedentota bacterium]HPO85926.1 hypothetical protein [Candidatus Hydrogenedentota bacterium]
MLPTVPFGELNITRLIVGGNPFRGNSHLNAQLSTEMLEFFTVERIKKTLAACEAHGINTVQARGDVFIQACLREYWAEGGRLHFIAQTASELRDLSGHVKQLARFGAVGIYVHGTFTDRHFQEGTFHEVQELLKAIRDTGVQTGLGTHIPEVVDYAEEKDLDVDFYMTCLHNLSRKPRESAIVSGNMDVQEEYRPEDRQAMYERIQRTRKTCLAFKIFAAGRLCGSSEQVRAVFEEVFANIKPCDAVVVGMFPKYRDQVAENVAIVSEILNASHGESVQASANAVKAERAPSKS